MEEKNKNINSGNIDTGGGSVHIGDINITNSVDYQKLKQAIIEQQEIIAELPEGEIKEKARFRLNDLIEQEKSFKEYVIKLAETFSKIEINTERLKQAKKFFDEGKFREANEILKVEEIEKEQNDLLKIKNKKENEIYELEQQLINNANEWLIKAQTTELRYDLVNRYELTIEYFESALKSYKDPEILFHYAYFLGYHREYTSAIFTYKEILSIYQNETGNKSQAVINLLAITLNNLALLETENNQYNEAKEHFIQRLNIDRELEKIYIIDYGYKIAVTLNNLALLESRNNHFNKARQYYLEALKKLEIFEKSKNLLPDSYEIFKAGLITNFANLIKADNNDYKRAKEYYFEALDIYKKINLKNCEDSFPYISRTLNDLANLEADNNEQSLAKDHYCEALRLNRILAKKNSYAHDLELAISLNNLGLIEAEMQEYSSAREYYLEALNLYIKLQKRNSGAHNWDMAMTLNNLANLEADNNDYIKSKDYYLKALKLFRELFEENSTAYNPSLAMVLNNLGNLESKFEQYNQASKHYVEALELRKKLLLLNPNAFIRDLASLLNNMARVDVYNNNLDLAITRYIEALELFRKLEKQNPNAYFLNITMILYNLSSSFKKIKDKNNSLKFAHEACEYIKPFIKTNPVAQEYDNILRTIIEYWSTAT